VMLGAAMARGAKLDPSTPMASLIPSPVTRPPSAPITMGHLLTHSSGLACDDNDDASPGNEERMQSQRTEPDWIRFTAMLPTVVDPGSRYAYCSAGINLAAGMIAKATNRWLPEFFDTEIARPLGFLDYHWNLTPSGDGYGGGGAYIRPRDLLKIGLLYLGNGAWNGRQIVPKSWVERSTAFQIKISDQTSDGFAWHRFQLDVAGRKYQEYEASGNGGQLVIVVPELQLVVVFTAGNYNQYPVWRTFRDELVPRYVIGAIRGR
jgi:CubicO group peptidase (beta-lactamase class C family)